MYFVDYSESRLFGSLPKDVLDDLINKNVTENFHQFGLTPEVKVFLTHQIGESAVCTHMRKFYLT